MYGFVFFVTISECVCINIYIYVYYVKAGK